ncbi:Aspartate 1-decarboxylase [hydrothermal vent metagenome]|uniref:Aspartate 1-decarboxylase n=1 Tax=hydrothermal vent metagenome TaxID=652676 RepID=A0A3B0VR38_9ZZZZ
MLRFVLKSKIHRATVTRSDLNYEGSLTIDRDLMEAAGLVPFEQVRVYNINNGERFETYVIEGEAGSGVIGLNGAAARKGLVGDLFIIASYAMIDDDELAAYRPRMLLLDEKNGIKKHIDK